MIVMNTKMIKEWIQTRTHTHPHTHTHMQGAATNEHGPMVCYEFVDGHNMEEVFAMKTHVLKTFWCVCVSE